MNKGEIWLINLDPTVGAEIRKTRPVVIVNEDAVGLLPLRLVVPITGWKEAFNAAPWMVRLLPTSLNGLEKVSALDAFQLRSVSQERFVRKLGQVNDSELEQVLRAILVVIGMD